MYNYELYKMILNIIQYGNFVYSKQAQENEDKVVKPMVMSVNNFWLIRLAIARMRLVDHMILSSWQGQG